MDFRANPPFIRVVLFFVFCVSNELESSYRFCSHSFVRSFNVAHSRIFSFFHLWFLVALMLLFSSKVLACMLFFFLFDFCLFRFAFDRNPSRGIPPPPPPFSSCVFSIIVCVRVSVFFHVFLPTLRQRSCKTRALEYLFYSQYIHCTFKHTHIPYAIYYIKYMTNSPIPRRRHETMIIERIHLQQRTNKRAKPNVCIHN